MANVRITLDRPYYECLEPLELAMALAAFDHDVKILLKGSSKELQQGRLPALPFSGKDLNKIMKSLALYDIEVATDEMASIGEANINDSDTDVTTYLVFD